MILRNFLGLTFLMLSGLSAFSQERCATNILLEEKKKSNPQLYQAIQSFKHTINQKVHEKARMKTSAVELVYTIPVVVHVVHNNSSGTIGGSSNTNISNAQIFAQIDILNQDYRRKVGTNGYNNDPVGADVNIEFCLASSDPNGNLTTGITRTYYPKSSWNYGSSADEDLLKSLSYWPSDQYLNIWVCNLANNVLGYSQFPAGSTLPGLGGDNGAATDGVVIDYQCFGTGGATKTPYNLGRTATHEIGHWLGLIHIWGDAVCGDDYVADTPWDKAPNDDNDCIDSSNCVNPSVYTPDMTNNYLDYSEDNCMNIFTQGQKLRMRTTMENAPRRVALLNSRGCCASIVDAVPLLEDFEGSGQSNWKNYSSNSTTIQWDTATVGNHSTASIYVDNDVANVKDSALFISPYFNFKNAHAALKFDLAYAEDLSGGTDTLGISYSTNCSSWTLLTKFSGNQLITTSTKTSNFTPMDADWKTIHIGLPGLNNKTGRIRFENLSDKKNKLYIDNINIYTTTSELTITPYPNPTTDKFFVDINFEGLQDVTVEMYDRIGQKLFTQTDYGMYRYSKEFEVGHMPRGIYILKVYAAGQSKTAKVFIDYK
jgi:hypothetical protein